MRIAYSMRTSRRDRTNSSSIISNMVCWQDIIKSKIHFNSCSMYHASTLLYYFYTFHLLF